MDINKIKDIFKKIGISLPAGAPFGIGSAYAQILSKLSSEKQEKLLLALRESMELSGDQLEAIKEELQNIGATTKEQIDQVIKLLEEVFIKRQRLSSAFSAPDYEFQFLIERNFLYKFDGSDNPDYLQLLSSDFNDLFFNFFNSNDCICISGRKGVGKTFNCLLISKKLEQEGYKVHYSSIRKAKLSEKTFSELTGLINADFVFIIDDCQSDTEKTEAILKRVIGLRKGTERPKLILLIRNDGLSEADIRDILGERIPILEFKERFTNFKFLAELFFRKINLTEKLGDFLSLLEKGDLSKALFKYKNMEFWNRFFRQVERTREIKIREEEFYKSAYEYLSDKEPHLIQCKDILGRFLLFFKNELSILRTYMKSTIEAYHEQYQILIDRGILVLEPQDWDDGSDLFIVSKLHSTEAEILQLVLQKYERVAIDEKAMLIDYLRSYPSNMYRLITPFYFYGTETLEELCRDKLFISEIRKYLREIDLGKPLDRVIRTFSKLESQLKDQLIDDEVIGSLAEKLNEKGQRYIVSKLYLFRAIYKLSPSKAYQLYKEFNTEVLVDDFRSDPRGLSSFSKFMEVSKNIYYYADKDGKTYIINTIKEVLERCTENFINKFEKFDLLAQLHWFMKRLDGMKLAKYSLAKIPPAKIVEWIRTKDVRIFELRFIFKNARFIRVRTDGAEENLYYYFRNCLSYEDVKRIFTNKRSKLYDIAITSKFNHEILSNYFYRYSFEDSFAEKVSTENNLYRINESISLVESNPGLSEKQKCFIICRIIDNTRFGERLLKETAKVAKRLGKKLDIHAEKERFLNYKEQYGATSSNKV